MPVFSFVAIFSVSNRIILTGILFDSQNFKTKSSSSKLSSSLNWKLT
jgi:hypothetical protein